MNWTSLNPRALTLFNTLDECRVSESWSIESLNSHQAFLDDLPHLGLAIVGTRHPQRRSLELVEKTIAELKSTRLIIVSGFARGIDAHAHEMAIRNGLRTLAILGCGIDQDYPKENHRLRKQILESGGMILSPFRAGEPPLARNFHERNGLIAGLSKATWVVEAAEVSGTLNTATWATRMSRQLYATPAFPGDPFYQGNEKLLGQKQSDRYPIAEAFYGSHSLGSTWADLESGLESQRAFDLNRKPKSEIQKWILELKSEFGICHVQSLMNHAAKNGHTLGQFYLQYESELASGLIKQSADGSVEANL